MIGIYGHRCMQNLPSITGIEPGEQGLMSYGRPAVPSLQEMVRSHLADVYRLSPDEVNIMTRLVADSVANLLNDMDQALLAADSATLALSAHTLKGVIASFGLDNQVCISSRLAKEAISEESLDSLNYLVVELRDRLGPLLTAFS